jgi:hypothetical protein
MEDVDVEATESVLGPITKLFHGRDKIIVKLIVVKKTCGSYFSF